MMLKKTRFSIERRDLSSLPIADLRRISHYVHTVSEMIAEADITSDVEVLADLEEAVGEEIAGIGRVLCRVERRMEKELAKRK